MPFDPSTFLDLATEIATTKPDEVHFRAAVGRAYYALFLMARAKTGVYTKADSHKAVHQAMNRRSDLKPVASKLHSLFEMRKAADYDLTPDAKYKNWVDNWNRAQQLVTSILPSLK